MTYAIVRILGGWRATAFALLALCALTATGVQTLRLKYQEGRAAKWAAAAAEAEVKAQLEAREAERRKAAELAAIADKYEQDKRAADEAQRKLVADLRAGTVRLQNRWAGCVSDVAATAAELDATRRDREESAARIVRAARDADDQIRALQDVVRKDREK